MSKEIKASVSAIEKELFPMGKRPSKHQRKNGKILDDYIELFNQRLFWLWNRCLNKNYYLILRNSSCFILKNTLYKAFIVIQIKF